MRRRPPVPYGDLGRARSLFLVEGPGPSRALPRPDARKRGGPAKVLGTTPSPGPGAIVYYLPTMTTLSSRRRRKRLLSRLLPPTMTRLPPSRRRKRLLRRIDILSHPLPFLADIAAS